MNKKNATKKNPKQKHNAAQHLCCRFWFKCVIYFQCCSRSHRVPSSIQMYCFLLFYLNENALQFEWGLLFTSGSHCFDCINICVITCSRHVFSSTSERWKLNENAMVNMLWIFCVLELFFVRKYLPMGRLKWDPKDDFMFALK